MTTGDRAIELDGAAVVRVDLVDDPELGRVLRLSVDGRLAVEAVRCGSRQIYLNGKMLP